MELQIKPKRSRSPTFLNCDGRSYVARRWKQLRASVIDDLGTEPDRLSASQAALIGCLVDISLRIEMMRTDAVEERPVDPQALNKLVRTYSKLAAQLGLENVATWRPVTPPTEPRAILKLLRDRAPVFHQAAANTVANSVPELVRIEETVLCRFCTPAELQDYSAKTSTLLQAFVQLGLEAYDLAHSRPDDQLGQLVGSRIMEACIGRSAKENDTVIVGMGASSDGPFMRQLPSHSKVVRRLPQ